MYYEMIERQYYCVESLKCKCKIPSWGGGHQCTKRTSIHSSPMLKINCPVSNKLPAPTPSPSPLPVSSHMTTHVTQFQLWKTTSARWELLSQAQRVWTGKPSCKIMLFLEPSQDSLHCWLELNDFHSKPIFCCTKVAFILKLDCMYLLCRDENSI
jgi:hypothetical protein